jgi:RNA polymerase sigma factor (sigma-70 family)
MTEIFDEFYQSNVRLVYATALSRNGIACAAEDLSQETFLRAWRSFDQIRGLAPPAQRAWLLTTLRNLTVDSVRKEKPDRWQSWESQPEQASDDNETAFLRLDVAKALTRLDPLDREIVILRYFADLSSREIGETLSMAESTVRRRLMTCREKLAVALAPWSEGETERTNGR